MNKPEVVDHEKSAPAVRRNKTPYETSTIYRSRSGTRYRADQTGTLRRVDGGKLSKAERKAVKRKAVREMKLHRGRGTAPRLAHNQEAVGSNPTPGTK